MINYGGFFVFEIPLSNSWCMFQSFAEMALFWKQKEIQPLTHFSIRTTFTDTFLKRDGCPNHFQFLDFLGPENFYKKRSRRLRCNIFFRLCCRSWAIKVFFFSDNCPSESELIIFFAKWSIEAFAPWFWIIRTKFSFFKRDNSYTLILPSVPFDKDLLELFHEFLHRHAKHFRILTDFAYSISRFSKSKCNIPHLSSVIQQFVNRRPVLSVFRCDPSHSWFLERNHLQEPLFI